MFIKWKFFVKVMFKYMFWVLFSRFNVMGIKFDRVLVYSVILLKVNIFWIFKIDF